MAAVAHLAPVANLHPLVELDNVGDAFVWVDLLAVLEHSNFVLSAGGLVVEVCHPLTIRSNVL